MYQYVLCISRRCSSLLLCVECILCAAVKLKVTRRDAFTTIWSELNTVAVCLFNASQQNNVRVRLYCGTHTHVENYYLGCCPPDFMSAPPTKVDRRVWPHVCATQRIHAQPHRNCFRSHHFVSAFWRTDSDARMLTCWFSTTYEPNKKNSCIQFAVCCSVCVFCVRIVVSSYYCLHGYV